MKSITNIYLLCFPLLQDMMALYISEITALIMMNQVLAVHTVNSTDFYWLMIHINTTSKMCCILTITFQSNEVR